jgi:hypothetical protein
VVDSLRRLREPAVVVLLVALALRLVLDVVGLAVVIDGGAGTGYPAGSAAVTGGDGLTLVVLAVLVGGCVLWSPTRHARVLTLAAAVLAGLTVAVYVVAVVGALAGSDTGGWAAVAGAVLALVVPLLVVVYLVTLWRGQPGAASHPQLAGRAQSVTAATPVSDEPTPALTSGPDPETAPVWQPDQAAGAAWLTAGDAAAGAAASRWGTPGDADGWQPQSERPQSDRPQPRPASTDPIRPEDRTGA